MPVVEQCAEQRRRRLYAAATLRQAQRRMFMAQQAGQPALHVTDLFQNAALGQLHAQRQGIDEHPQRPAGALAALHAPEQHRAEHHVVAPGGPRQHRGPGQMKQAGGADAQGSGLFPQALRQIRGDGQSGFLNPAAVAQDVEQAERRRRLVDIGQHVAEKGFVFFRLHPQPGLRDKVAERQRRRQLLRPAQLVHQDLLQQDVDRGVIDRQMVCQQQQQPALFPGVIGGVAVDQRRLAHVDAIMSRMVTFLQLFGRLAGFRVDDDLLDRQFRGAPDHLYRFRQAFPGHGRAQDIVTVDYRLQGAQETVEAFARVERHQVRQQVGIAFGLHQMVEQNAFLQRRQRIDVLHVGRPARHRGRDLVYILRRQIQ